MGKCRGKKILALGVIALLLTFGGLYSGNYTDGVNQYIRGTYTTSQVDTVLFARHERLIGASLGVVWYDSVKVTNIILRRIYNGQWLAVQAGDTISAFTTVSTVTANDPTTVKVGTITLTPYCDSYAFIVTYGTDCGVTNNKVAYLFEQQVN